MDTNKVSNILKYLYNDSGITCACLLIAAREEESESEDSKGSGLFKTKAAAIESRP